MREELQKICIEFIHDRDVAKEAFAWENSYMPPICAGILADKTQSISAEQLKEAKQYIKEQTGIFSNFRGTVIAPMATMLAMREDTEAMFSFTQEIYDELKRYFYSSQYLPLVAMILAQMTEQSQYQYVVQKTRQIYDMMKKEHPILTSSEDGPFAAMLAFASSSPEAITYEVEKCYQLLKPKFFSGNAVQSLSHVLALGEGSAEAKCAKLENLFLALKEKGCKYGTDYQLATLGAISILPYEVSQIVQDMTEVSDYLEQQKGYGFFGVSKRDRYMHAAMLVCKDYVGKSGNQVMNSTAVTSTIVMIAAQQAAVCAAVAATAASSASSSS